MSARGRGSSPCAGVTAARQVWQQHSTHSTARAAQGYGDRGPRPCAGSARLGGGVTHLGERLGRAGLTYTEGKGCASPTRATSLFGDRVMERGGREGGRGRGSAKPPSCEPLAVLSSEARGLCATVHLSPHATSQQPSEAKGLLGSIDHVEEAILVLLLLIDLRDRSRHADHAVLVHQQEERLGGIQLQAAPVGARAGGARSAHLKARSTPPAVLFPWGQACTARTSSHSSGHGIHESS